MRNALKLSHYARVKFVAIGIGKVGVYSHSVGVGDYCGVVRALHSAFDLEGVDSCFYKLGDHLDRAHILRGHNKRAKLVLLDGVGLIGALFLGYDVVPSARLSARAAVGVAAREAVGEHASAAVGHAHRAVNERLKLDALGERCLDSLYLAKRQLASENESLCTERDVSKSRLGTYDACLSRDVYLGVGNDRAKQRHNAEIGNDKGVDACILDIFKKGAKRRVFVSVWHSIERKIELFSTRVDVFGGVKQLLVCKIVCGGAHTEARSRKINGIRTVKQRRLKLFKVSRRG